MLIQEMKKYQMLMDDTNSRFKDDLYESLIDQEAKKIYLEWRSMGAMLTESKLSQEQIQQIFGAIEAGAKAGKNVDYVGMGSTVGDYSGDAPKRGIIGSLSQGWSNLKDKISQSRPIAGFDVAFDKLQGKLLKSAGGQSGTIGKMLAAYKKFGDTYPRMQSFLYYALTAAAAVSGWGLGATAIMAALRTINGLLQGDRLSSAAWKGIKTMALGAAAAELFPQPVEGGGDAAATTTSGPPPTVTPSSVTVNPGDTLSQIAQSNNVSVDQMLQANPGITNPDVLKAGQSLNIPSPTGTAVYDKGIGTAADTLKKIGTGAYTDSEISRAMAAKAGLKENINFNRMNRIWQTQKDLKLPQSCSVYLTKNGVENIFIATETKIVSEGIFDTFKNKITKDKLDLFWRKNYGEYSQDDGVDSNTLIDFLRRMGVKNGLIKNVFDELKIPMGPVTPADTTAASTVSADSGAGSTDTATATKASSTAAADSTTAAPTSEPDAAAPQPEAKPNPDDMAAQLKQLWDKWSELDASIGAPAVKRQLKSMWMSSGGTSANESKKRKLGKKKIL